MEGSGTIEGGGSAEMSEAPRMREGSLRNLTVSIVALLVLYPLVAESIRGRLAMNLLMTVIFFFGIRAAGSSRKHTAIAVSIAVPWFVLTWMEEISADPSLGLGLTVNTLAILFFGFTLLVILAFVVQAERVTRDVLYGAAAIYLLLGGLWFLFYVFVDRLHPGAFLDNGVGGGSPADWPALLYYSYVTLTTLGFGDIVPATPIARHLTITEAIAGVLYLPFVIGRLIGINMAQSRER